MLILFYFSDRDEADGSENEHSDDGEWFCISLSLCMKNI